MFLTGVIKKYVTLHLIDHSLALVTDQYTLVKIGDFNFTFEPYDF